MSKWAQLAGRLALGAIFVVSGLGKLTAWRGMVAFAGSKGIPEVLLAIATALELFGGVSVVLGFRARFGALALLIFLVPVTLVFHNFWAVPPEQHQMQMVNFMKNLSIGGGLLIVLGRGAGAYGIDGRGASAGGGSLPGSAAR